MTPMARALSLELLHDAIESLRQLDNPSRNVAEWHRAATILYALRRKLSADAENTDIMDACTELNDKLVKSASLVADELNVDTASSDELAALLKMCEITTTFIGDQSARHVGAELDAVTVNIHEIASAHKASLNTTVTTNETGDEVFTHAKLK